MLPSANHNKGRTNKRHCRPWSRYQYNINKTSLFVEVHKTKIKIKPFGSKTLRCSGYYVGTVMCEDGVANLKIYAINEDVETFLSAQAAEALGIIKFDANPSTESTHQNQTYEK